jgi:hypothetical protein
MKTAQIARAAAVRIRRLKRMKFSRVWREARPRREIARMS